MFNLKLLMELEIIAPYKTSDSDPITGLEIKEYGKDWNGWARPERKNPKLWCCINPGAITGGARPLVLNDLASAQAVQNLLKVWLNPQD